MDKTERARLLDTLRKRRSRKRERALNEGKPEDFYITAEDFIEHYESTEQDADEQVTPAPVKRTPSARTSGTRQKRAPAPEPAQDEQPISAGWLIGAGVFILGVVIGVPLWIARNAG